MHIERALDQLDEIHGHLSRSEVYRGFRSLHVGLTGVTALLAASLQTTVIASPSPRLFVLFWISIAVANAGLAGGVMAFNYFRRESGLEQKRTVKVVSQFLPALGIGALMTVALTFLSEEFIPLLPGLWALTFALGIFASRPFLPRAIGWIGMLYVLAGAHLLTLAPDARSLAPWAMGITFGSGQLLSALVLYWNLERNSDG